MSVGWTVLKGEERAQMGKQKEECTVRFDEGLFVMRTRWVASHVLWQEVWWGEYGDIWIFR